MRAVKNGQGIAVRHVAPLWIRFCQMADQSALRSCVEVKEQRQVTGRCAGRASCYQRRETVFLDARVDGR